MIALKNWIFVLLVTFVNIFEQILQKSRYVTCGIYSWRFFGWKIFLNLLKKVLKVIGKVEIVHILLPWVLLIFIKKQNIGIVNCIVNCFVNSNGIIFVKYILDAIILNSNYFKPLSYIDSF